jgi:hypothetical protein
LTLRPGKNANYLPSLLRYVEKVNCFIPLLGHGEMKYDGMMYTYKTWVNKTERSNNKDKDMKRKEERNDDRMKK